MSRTESKDNFLLNVIKGIGTALIVALVGVLIFAAVVKIASLSETVIKSVNQFIKVLAVFLGCFFSVRGGKGLIKGAFIGAISTAIMQLLFAFFGGNVSFGLGFILDVVFTLIIGAISGVIVVNLRKD